MVALIVEKSKNNVIGKDGKIPWDIKNKQEQIEKLTTNNTIIMGRNTFENIGRPLPNRWNFVISKSHNYKGNNIITFRSLESALNLATDKAYIIGGYSLFKEALSLVDEMYITELDLEIEDGNLFFPEFNEDDFNKHLIDEDEMYKRYVYTRK